MTRLTPPSSRTRLRIVNKSHVPMFSTTVGGEPGTWYVVSVRLRRILTVGRWSLYLHRSRVKESVERIEWFGGGEA